MRQTVVVVARNDSYGVFVRSKLRASSTKKSAKALNTLFRARELMATPPMKKRLLPNFCWSPGGFFNQKADVFEKKVQTVKSRSRVR